MTNPDTNLLKSCLISVNHWGLVHLTCYVRWLRPGKYSYCKNGQRENCTHSETANAPVSALCRSKILPILITMWRAMHDILHLARRIGRAIACEVRMLTQTGCVACHAAYRILIVIPMMVVQSQTMPVSVLHWGRRETLLWTENQHSWSQCYFSLKEISADYSPSARLT